MNVNKNIERDIYEFLKSNPDKLPQIVRHYKLIKKTFPNNDSVLKINQRPLAKEEYFKEIIADFKKLNNSQNLLKQVLSYNAVSLLKNSTVKITITKKYIDDLPQIRQILLVAKNENSSNVANDIIDSTISQINDGIASINANMDYSNIFHTKSLSIKNIWRDDDLESLTDNKRWSSIKELKEYIDSEDLKSADNYKTNALDDDFTIEEQNQFNNVLDIYDTKQVDHMYFRFAPFTDDEMTYDEWRNYLVERYMKLNNSDYYKMISVEYPEVLNEILNSSELPTYSDIIAYGNKKYERIKKLEEFVN